MAVDDVAGRPLLLPEAYYMYNKQELNYRKQIVRHLCTQYIEGIYNNPVTLKWVRGHSRSLKMVPFKMLGTVSHSSSVVTTAISASVCEIFSIKEWCDLENRVRVHSRSLEMAPFDRSHMCSYSRSIVTMLSCIVCNT